jgi:DNA invertase Pin-like site-specific DNA recombinase
LDIIEAAALADQRRLEAADTARKVQRLRNQGLPRRAIVARLGISASQYQRACQANSSRLR